MRFFYYPIDRHNSAISSIFLWPKYVVDPCLDKTDVGGMQTSQYYVKEYTPCCFHVTSEAYPRLENWEGFGGPR